MENLPNGQVQVTANNINNNSTSNRTSDCEADLEFLPLIYEIIKSIEREPTHDTSQKTRADQDTSVRILDLEKKLNLAREQINHLAGIKHSEEEQLKQVDNLRKQLQLKRQLLSKYRNMCSFCVNK